MEDKYFIKDICTPNGVIRYSKPTKEQLLEQYAELQVCGFLRMEASGPCEEGAEIYSTPTYQLDFWREHVPVRVLVVEGTSKRDTLRYISEIVKVLQEDWHRLDQFGAGQRPKFIPPEDQKA